MHYYSCLCLGEVTEQSRRRGNLARSQERLELGATLVQTTSRESDTQAPSVMNNSYNPHQARRRSFIIDQTINVE